MTTFLDAPGVFKMLIFKILILSFLKQIFIVDENMPASYEKACIENRLNEVHDLLTADRPGKIAKIKSRILWTTQI